MADSLLIRPIAHIETDFQDKFGIPRQSGRVPALSGRIVFRPEFRNPDALREIESFSHLWLIFDFSMAHRDTWSPTVRPPRLGGNRRVGVFASRSPFRPNPLGLSCVKLERVEHHAEEGDVLIVSGVDLLDGTPIYDIKPYLPFADAHPEAVGGYADQEAGHRLDVDFPEELLAMLPPEKREAVLACLSEDPRPSYQDDPERVYSMRFAGYDVHFRVADGRATVIGVD
ncbi:MAG: tRNA (N6-threonylcarbamoyladenosine(37)-N6)-methyltransferase TrmO [Ruminococcaceae bacterium]|nr:tRNA (N6-threonylcarbamoyladenosine(37)-N6)-methyltransferase TrmO [Oscillospiraceae bacterium]